MTDAYVHPTASVEEGAQLGTETKVWHYVHVRKGAQIGKGCSIGKDCYVDGKVTIGEGSRIQNGVSIYDGVQIRPYVFVGPHVVFTNDLYPRAGVKGWKVIDTVLHSGSAVGAGAVLRCGIEIGAFAMIGAGALVTKSVEPFTLVLGSPATPYKKICACGKTQFDLESPDWKPVLPCCEETLIAPLLNLAKSEAR
ncbi:MAG: acyltransferase [Bdellovibrionales bacterium]